MVEIGWLVHSPGDKWWSWMTNFVLKELRDVFDVINLVDAVATVRCGVLHSPLNFFRILEH